MSKKHLLCLIFIFMSKVSFCQKFGYIDTEFILSKVEDYKKAEGEIEALAAKYTGEIQGLFTKVDQLNREFKAEEILLTEDMRKERQDTIAANDKKARDLQKKIFGYEGLIFLKRQELLKPVQEKVFAAVEKVARRRQLAIIFDKSSELIMVYTDPKHDYTDYVLESLGLGDPKDTIDNKRYKEKQE